MTTITLPRSCECDHEELSCRNNVSQSQHERGKYVHVYFVSTARCIFSQVRRCVANARRLIRLIRFCFFLCSGNESYERINTRASRRKEGEKAVVIVSFEKRWSHRTTPRIVCEAVHFRFLNKTGKNHVFSRSAKHYGARRNDGRR